VPIYIQEKIYPQAIIENVRALTPSPLPKERESHHFTTI
jgi:hypothetical protein